VNEWSAQTPVPPVYTWYKVYCAAMAVMYLFVAIVGVLFLAGVSFMPAQDQDKLAGLIVGPMYIIMGLAFMVPFILALFLSPKPWVWIYGLVLICLGMTSCCCLPASIPLLIYWIKPDVKLYFGRSAS